MCCAGGMNSGIRQPENGLGLCGLSFSGCLECADSRTQKILPMEQDFCLGSNQIFIYGKHHLAAE